VLVPNKRISLVI